MRNFLNRFSRDECGVSALEYAVLAGVIVVALTAAGSVFSSSLTTMFTTLFTNVTAAQSAASAPVGASG